MIIIFAVLGCVTMSGILLFVYGVGRREHGDAPVQFPQLSLNSPIVVGGGLACLGGLLALLTGWLFFIPVLPLAGLAAPYLLGRTPAQIRLAQVEALEEWTRGLAGILSAGAGLEQGLIASAGSCPEAVKVPVTTLASRLSARWTTDAALREFAADLGHSTGDHIVASLLLGSQHRGEGLTTMLNDLCEGVGLDLRGRRQVEADAAKPRATARWVTIITGLVLLGLFLGGQYMSAYKTGPGQVIVMGLLIGYAVVVVWMRRITTIDADMRLLGSQASRRV
ncbi:MAG: type II secretion system F family protein [Propionibacteriaceae bacterium]|nr:type II secretion system F family protein [Propionibacteriaceae bacterium]